jgi:hypothetical protein
MIKPEADPKSIRVGGLTLSIGSSGFSIIKDKSDVHLTMCFNIKRNSFDAHFTNQKTNEIVSRYEIGLDKFIEFGEFVEKELRSNLGIYFIRINLGKLGRGGWIVAAPQQKQVESAFQASVKRYKKRKLILDGKKLSKRMLVHVKSNFHFPCELKNMEDSELAGPIYLMGDRNRNNHKQKYLMVSRVNGNRRYYIFRLNKFMWKIHHELFSQFKDRSEEFSSEFDKYIGWGFLENQFQR